MRDSISQSAQVQVSAVGPVQVTEAIRPKFLHGTLTNWFCHFLFRGMFRHTCGHVTTALQNEASRLHRGPDDTEALKSNDTFDDVPKEANRAPRRQSKGVDCVKCTNDLALIARTGAALILEA